ncbi:putative ribonuclease H-like domain-containing protein, partial [Tanacetum coccineum]
LGKFDGKSDEGFFVGYSLSSKAFRVYNTRTRRVEENLHIGFLENKPMIEGNGPKWLFNIDSLTQSMNYVLVTAGMMIIVNQKLFDDAQKQLEDGTKIKIAEEDKFEDDSSTKDVNAAGQHVNTASPDVNTGVSHTLKATHIEFFSDEDEPEIEPTSIAKALFDLSWVESMQEELLQFKTSTKMFGYMWICLIEKGPLKQKWVFENKTDERGICAFLYGTIEEEVYVTQPLGFKDPDHPDKVYKVVKKEDGIFINQDKYIAEILKKFNYTDVKSASTLVDLEKPLVKDGDADDVDVHLYRSMIGSLMYLTASRPDIMFVVCACARFQVTPKTSHLLAVKRIFRYLKGKPTLGLWYSRDSPFELVAYTDSDYAGATQDRKSTTGGCQFLGNRLISWQCKKQTVVATSTTEAEYVAAASCCGQVLWIQNQLLDYGYNFMHTMIHIDNNSTICIIENPVQHSKTKHIEIRHHFIRDCNAKKLIQMVKIDTEHNVADLLTKGFDAGRHVKRGRDTKIPQSSGPPVKVGDEAVHKELGDRMERAATTASSLEAEQDNASEEVGKDSDHPTDSTQIHILDQPSTSSKPKKKQPSKKTQRHEVEVSQDETKHEERNQSNGNTDPPFSSSLKDSPDAGFKPSGEEDKKDAEDLGKDSEIPKDNSIDENIVYGCADDLNVPELEDIVYSGDDEDVGVVQALKDPSWIEAMQEELLQFKFQQVWTLVDLPHGKRAIGTKWVYRNKKDERGIVIKNKARLVAKGHTQEEGIDYDEVFAHVARIKAIRLFLAYASFKDFMAYQMDVKSAFLYGKIEEEIYLCQPPGFEDPDFPNKKSFCTEFEKMMHKKFQMSFMGELTFFLGLQVKQKEDGIFISQDKYVIEILKKFGFSDVKTASTPMETHKPLLKDADGEDVDEHLYRSMIGSLMYLTSSRPNIMFAVCACARFQVNPKNSHLHAVKRIFRCLKGQPKLGLWYPKDLPFDLVAYTDSDYAGASLDRKSTTRELIKDDLKWNATAAKDDIAVNTGNGLGLINDMMDKLIEMDLEFILLGKI